MILIIDRKNSAIHYETGSLLIEQPGSPRQRAPIQQLELLIIHGSATISASALRALATAAIPTVIPGANGRQQTAHLGPGLASQLPLRRSQHRAAETPETQARLAAWIVRRKLQSYSIALDALRPHISDQTTLKTYCQAHRQALQNLAHADNAATVRGIEGSAARAWFTLLAATLPPQWQFSGRNRRPPKDPVNALLSLGYTLLHAEVRNQTTAWGLDPALGFLHEDYPGREGLSLDICEPFRAGVDKLVIDLLYQQKIHPDDFYYRNNEGCRLAKKIRPQFFNAWAQQRENWPMPRDATDQPNDDTAPLRQRIGGLIQQFRQQLQGENHD